MAVAAWTINIRLVTNSNASLAFSRISQSAGGAEKNVSKLNGTLSQLKTVGLAGLVALGVAAGETFATGVKGAAALQDALVNTAISTGNLGKTFGQTMRNMAQFHTLALKMSMTTAQSVDQSMGLLGIMAASGIKPKDLPKLAMPIAQYADVQYLGKDHVPFQESVKTAAMLSHDLQVFDPRTMSSVLNHLYKMGYSSPDSIARIFTQIRYFASKGISSGLSRDDVLNLGAWLDRMGLGKGRGGSGLNMLIKNLQAPTGNVKMSNLHALGVYNSDGTSRFVNAKTGAVDLMGLINYIAQQRNVWIARGQGAAFNQHIARGFDTNAANVLQTLATKGGMEQLKRLLDQQSKMPSLQQAQVQLMGTLNNQTKLLISNFHTLATEIGFTLLPELTNFVSGLAAATGKLALWMHNHPAAAHAAGYGLLATAGLGAYAALKLGGHYIAHAAPWMLRRGPMRLAAGVLGIGAEGAAAQSRVAGTLLRSLGLGGGWKGLFGAGETRAMLGVGLGKGKSGFLKMALRDLGSAFELVGKKTLISRVGLGLVGEILVKLGLRAIPVVGEILTLIDTIKFLGNHSFSIGKLIGEGAHLIVDGLKTAWGYIAGFFHNLVAFVMGGPSAWLRAGGNIVNWFRNAGGNLISGVGAGWNAIDAPHAHGGHAAHHALRHRVAHASTGGYTTGNGLAYLHKSELVVNAPLTKCLDALTRSAERRGGGRPVIIRFGDINVDGAGANIRNLPRKIAKEIAYQVAAILGDDIRLGTGQSVIADAGFSEYELTGGMA